MSKALRKQQRIRMRYKACRLSEVGDKPRRQMRQRLPWLSRAILLVLLVWLGPAAAHAQAGIAAQYLRDVGIENDPDVVLVEMFETGTVSTIASRWTSSLNTAGMSLVQDVPPASSGTRSLRMTSIGGANDGGQLFQKLSPGHDQLYLRYYIKYSSSGTYHHTGGMIGGYYPPTDWPQGGAGERPVGNDRFSVFPEPSSPTTRFDLYTYWMEMRPFGPDYWGNQFIMNPSVTITPNQWMCVEVMLKMNNPVSARNGELALWLNGNQIIHLRQGAPNGNWVVNQFFPDPAGLPFEGFRWRSDSLLNLNWIWLLYFTTDNPSGFVGEVRFDHVVVAKRYIGPINTSPVESPPAAPSNLVVN